MLLKQTKLHLNPPPAAMMGQVEKSRGICRGLILLLPGIQVREDFLPLDLGSTRRNFENEMVTLTGKDESELEIINNQVLNRWSGSNTWG